MLTAGPVLALNLLKVDDSYEGPDQVNWTTLSLDAGKHNPVVSDPGITYGEVDYLAETVDKEVYDTSTGATIPFVGKTPYASLFDRSRFWLPSDHNLLQVTAAGLGVGGSSTFEKSSFISFANCGTDEISILCYKPEGFTGYDITAKEWYGGTENIPFKWIRPSDYISDYFIRVVAVKGNWSNYPILSSDSIWGKYFNQTGILKDKIFQFSQAEGISFIGSWTGCIIPDFTDKQGNYLYIKDKVNAQTEITGVLMSINEEAMEIISYDLNGMDVETGNMSGKGSWIYDYDGNSEGDSEAGETEVDPAKGYLIDMVGHGFQNGIKGETENKELKNKFPSVIFDGSTGTLGIDTSVYYLDDADALNMSDVSYVTTVKVPEFAEVTSIGTGTNKITMVKGEPLYLYGVYDVSTGRRLADDYCYVALTDKAFKANKSESEKIKGLSVYNKDGKADANNKTVSNIISEEGVVAVKLMNDLKDNTKYKDTSVYYGNYAAYANNQLFVYSIDSTGIVDEGIVAKDQMTTATEDIAGTEKSVLKYDVKSASTTVMIDETTSKFYVKEDTGVASVFGINFMSYNYVSDNREEVLCNVRNCYYFNGYKNTTAASDMSKMVTLEETGMFKNNNPVNADTLNMFIITDEEEARNISVNDLVPNITFHNRVGEATKYGLIPGVTRITSKIFVNLSSDNKFTYKGKTYIFNTNASEGGANPIRTKTGKRGFYLITAVDPVLIESFRITRQYPISNNVISKSLRFIPLKGLHIASRHRPGYDQNGRISANEGVKKIYSVLNETGIHRALTDTNRLQFRYIVDSMSFGLDNSMGGKKYLSELAADRGSTTALLSAPSRAQFQNSNDPVFCETYDANAYVKPAFDSKFIPMGGNADMYSTKQFSLPTEDEGSKFTGVFFPHLVYQESTKNILVPPAADISNVMMRKYNGTAGPYDIMAGVNGTITNPEVKGVEYDVDQYDRDNLEPFGINSIISENGRIMIYGNRTAYQVTKSDFNLLHVRENLNVLESSCKIVLKTYNFKYNTPQTRAEVYQALVPIFEAMKASRALMWYELVCDATNNTPEIVEQDILLVDASVILSHGMEKIVQRFTVKRQSDMPSE